MPLPDPPKRGASPGLSRSQRIGDSGLQRLEKQLMAGIRINPQVLEQWIRRYGEEARRLIERYRR